MQEVCQLLWSVVSPGSDHVSVVLVDQVVVDHLDHPVRRDEDASSADAHHRPDLLHGQHTGLQYSQNLTLFKKLALLGPDLNLIPEGQLGVLVQRVNLVSVGAEVLDLLLDDLLDGESV